METGKESNSFKDKSIIVVCWAGSDRGPAIAEELNQRGYFAEARGVMSGGHNYITQEDLASVGTIVFSSCNEKREFDQIGRLRKYVKKNCINVRVLNISESDKDKAFNSPDKADFIQTIKNNLDGAGLIDLQ